MGSSVLVFAAVYAALQVGHAVGDHWVQTHTQACDKGKQDEDRWVGRWAAARHVLSLTATKLITVLTTAAVLNVAVAPGWLALGLAVDAVSHWWADRRSTLVRLACWLDSTGLVPGKATFVRLGDGAAAPCGTGHYALDQSWHHAWLWIAALIVAWGSGGAA